MDPEFMTRYLPEDADDPGGDVFRSVEAEPDIGAEPDVAQVSESAVGERYGPEAPTRGHTPSWPAASGEQSLVAAVDDPRFTHAVQPSPRRRACTPQANSIIY